MMTAKQMLVTSGLILSMTVFSGCGSTELGPADPSKVPVVDPATLQKEVTREEGKKYLPKGFQGPKGEMPENKSSK